MTLNTTYSPTVADGNGVTTSFSYSFNPISASYLKVSLEVNGEWVQQLSGWTATTSSNGGVVTFSTAPTSRVCIERVIPEEQPTSYETSSGFQAKVIEHSFDMLTGMVQQLQERSDRSVYVDVGSDVDPQEVVKQVSRVYSSIDNVDDVADDLTNINAVQADLTNIDTVAGSISNVNAVGADIANVNTVSADLTNVNTVATNIADVNSVAGDIVKVTAVADDLTNIDAVQADLTNVDTVAGGISNVGIVAGDIANVNTVAGDKTNIDAVAGNKTNIDTVATNISNVNAVGGNITKVNAVANNETNINAVYANSANINTVATNIADVNSVAGDIARVGSVANDLTNIDSVAGDLTNIDAVNSNKANIDTVAGAISNVNAVGNNIAKVTAVEADLTNVDTVATNITKVNNVGNNINKVTAVADDLTNIDAVNTNKTNIDAVAGITSDVTTVAGVASDVTAVAGVASGLGDIIANETNITTVATNITNVALVGTNIGNVNTVAGDSAKINTCANNIASINNAPTQATNARKWAEGSDADVSALGGTHSSKGWAEIAEAAASGVQNPANRDLSNLTTTGQMIIDSANGTISNCILEIPQNIKLEISGGTITMKSGSIMTLSGGTYATYTIASDMSRDFSSHTDRIFPILVNSTKNNFTAPAPIGEWQSGSTVPTGSIAGCTRYFCSSNKVIYYWTGTSWAGGDGAFGYPVGLAKIENGIVSLVKDSNGNDMIFNGACFVGHHAVVYPNVNGLTSNGLNIDKNLNSLKGTVSSVQIVELSSGDSIIDVTNAGACSRIKAYTEVTALDTTQGLQYLIPENKPYLYNGSTYSFRTETPLIFYTYNGTTVTDFTIRQPYEGARNLLTDDIEKELATKQVDVTTLTGYDSTQTQTLKNINGVLTWVTD